MLFPHLLLDSVLDTLNHFNPAGYDLTKEGCYDTEASLMFSHVFMLVSRTDGVATPENIARLSIYIFNTLTTLLGGRTVDVNICRSVAKTILESAEQIELTLKNETYTLLQGQLGFYEDDEDEFEDDEHSISRTVTLPEAVQSTKADEKKKWDLN